MIVDDSVGLARALFEEIGDALFLLDPETDRLLARLHGDDADRQVAAWALHGRINDESPLLFLWQWDAWTAWSDELEYTPIAPGDAFADVERWKRAR